MSMDNVKFYIQNMAAAVGFFFTGIIVAYVTWDMVGTILNLYNNSLLKGIMWAGYLALIVLWIVIVPVWRAIIAHQGPTGGSMG